MKKFSFKRFIHLLNEYLYVTFFVFVTAFAFNVFFSSFKMIISGSSGVSIILNELFNINPATFVLSFHIFALILGYLLLPHKYVHRSIYGTFIYPFFIQLTMGLKTVVLNYGIADSDFLIFIILGSVMMGIGSGMLYKKGYTNGGSDIIVLIINRYLGTTIGTSSFILNSTIILTGGFVLGTEKILYAILILFIISKTEDFIILGNYSNKLLIVNSKKQEEIEDYILDNLDLNFTKMKSKGVFLNRDNELLMCFVSNQDYYYLKKAIKGIDKKAFIFVTHAYDYKKRIKYASN